VYRVGSEKTELIAKFNRVPHLNVSLAGLGEEQETIVVTGLSNLQT